MTVVASGRNPFSLFLLIALVVAGVSGLWDPAQASAAVAHLLPHWELSIWYGGLVVSAGIALAGILSKNVTALLVERVGLTVLCVLTLGYCAAVVVAGSAGNVAALIAAGLAVACCSRVIQISRDLRRIDRSPLTGPAPTAQEEPPGGGAQ